MADSLRLKSSGDAFLFFDELVDRNCSMRIMLMLR